MRYEKNMRILTDILGYCFYLGGNNFHTDFSMQPTQSCLTITADIVGLPDEEVEHVALLLNIPRQRDVEQHYWNISGEEEIDGELSLAGMMVDTADVHYDGHVLTIKVMRVED